VFFKAYALVTINIFTRLFEICQIKTGDSFFGIQDILETSVAPASLPILKWAVEIFIEHTGDRNPINGIACF
jgi:hypothetical protein